MKKKFKRLLLIAGGLLILFIGFLFWYKYTYSMDIIEGFEVNPEIEKPKLLIASQGSEYKEALVDNIVEHFKEKEVYIQVIDVTTIENIDPNDWDAIFICHVFEIWEPQVDAEAFLNSHYDPDKMVVFATSGSGDMKMDNIDGICGASILNEIDEKSELIIEKLESILF